MRHTCELRDTPWDLFNLEPLGCSGSWWLRTGSVRQVHCDPRSPHVLSSVHIIPTWLEVPAQLWPGQLCLVTVTISFGKKGLKLVPLPQSASQMESSKWTIGKFLLGFWGQDAVHRRLLSVSLAVNSFFFPQLSRHDSEKKERTMSYSL